jgi:hypothetical protein
MTVIAPLTQITAHDKHGEQDLGKELNYAHEMVLLIKTVKSL